MRIKSKTTTSSSTTTSTTANVMTRMIVMMTSIFLLSASCQRTATMMRSLAFSTTKTTKITTRSMTIQQRTTATTTKTIGMSTPSFSRKFALSSTSSSTTTSATDQTASSSSEKQQQQQEQEQEQEQVPLPDMEDIVSLCKRRGIIFPSSDIYNGYAGFYDYGPLGAELKKNLKDVWWRHFVTQREDVVGLDSSIIHNPTTWKSSGTGVSW